MRHMASETFSTVVAILQGLFGRIRAVSRLVWDQFFVYDHM